MTTAVVAVPVDASIDEVFELLLRHHVSGLPVVDHENRIKGVVSELDLLLLLHNPETEKGCVSDYLSGNVLTVEEDDPLTEVAELFLSNNFRRLPVVREGRLVGVISRRDLVRYIRDIRARVQIEMESRRRVRACSA